jgi:hypothetical protein
VTNMVGPINFFETQTWWVLKILENFPTLFPPMLGDYQKNMNRPPCCYIHCISYLSTRKEKLESIGQFTNYQGWKLWKNHWPCKLSLIIRLLLGFSWKQVGFLSILNGRWKMWWQCTFGGVKNLCPKSLRVNVVWHWKEVTMLTMVFILKHYWNVLFDVLDKGFTLHLM